MGHIPIQVAHLYEITAQQNCQYPPVTRDISKNVSLEISARTCHLRYQQECVTRDISKNEDDMFVNCNWVDTRWQ